MKVFKYKDKLYARIIPTKALLRSTTIYEVTVRGDCFCVCLDDMVFTVIPGEFEAEFKEVILVVETAVIGMDGKPQLSRYI